MKDLQKIIYKDWKLKQFDGLLRKFTVWSLKYLWSKQSRTWRCFFAQWGFHLWRRCTMERSWLWILWRVLWLDSTFSGDSLMMTLPEPLWAQELLCHLFVTLSWHWQRPYSLIQALIFHELGGTGLLLRYQMLIIWVNIHEMFVFLMSSCLHMEQNIYFKNKSSSRILRMKRKYCFSLFSIK